MITGAGHSRSCKSFFVRKDIAYKLNKILLCGIPENIKYPKPSKWNSYYAMCSTDSIPLLDMPTPNIIIVDDFVKYVREYVDEVEEYALDGAKKYRVNNNVKRKVKIMPFDGAGMCTPECARKWADKLDIRNKSGNRYIPSAFQFRAIPGIKGMLYVADIYKFAKEFNCWQIRDIWGKIWDLRKVKIDCILTKSQFKFHDLYNSYEHWKTEFEKILYGYKRTFNIASYSEDVCDLKRETMLSYQPLQTLLFTKTEIQSITLRGYEIYQRISKDIDEFIKYRGMMQTVNDETGELEADESLPPYYHALLYDKSLYNDKYVRGKVKEDIDNFRNNILSGKCIVDGNYQTLTVDIYAFMEYIFGIPVNGLLRKGQVYSNFWNTYHKNQKEIDIIRSPHIAMEHRIGYLRKSDRMLKWYKYQTAGIITSIHDTYLLALGGADADGDEVCTTSNYEVISAVKREITAGHGRTIYFKKLDSHSDRSCYIDDVSSLMRVNLDSFKNSIGNVINEITKLWSMKLTEDVRDAIKICSCIGALVIDFAKTGEPSEIPTDIKRMLKNVKKPYFMRYLKKNRIMARQEENAIKTAIDAKKSKEYIECLKAFEDTDSNMNRLCKHMEDIIQKRDITPYYEDESFNHECLMNQKKPVISREVRKTVLELHEMYSDIGTEYNMEKRAESDELKKDYASRYRYLYDNARWELLNMCNSVGKLVDMLVAIYYTDRRLKDKSKDMLWNTFGNELAKRCKGESIEYSFEVNLIKAKRYQSGKVLKEKVLDKQQVKKAKIQTMEADSVADNKIMFSLEDRKYIKGCVDSLVVSGKMKELHKVDCMRFYAVLLLITRKLQSDSFVKYPNKPDDITDLTLSKIAGIDRRKIKAFLVLLEAADFIEVDIDKHNVVKIKVNYQPPVAVNQSDLWINEQNYSVACTKIRDYFRK